MIRFGKLVSLVIGFAVLATLLVIYGRSGDEASSPAANPPSSASVLNVAVGPEPETLDPGRYQTVQAATVARDLFEGLMVYTPDGTLEGGVAERWEISPDGLTYRFWLRPEGRWSNGDPVTAEDFVFSFRRLVDPATAAFFGNTLSPVVNAEAILAGATSPDQLGVEAVGEHEFVIRLNQPVAYFLAQLAQAAVMPVHAKTIDLYKVDPRPENLVSNGAYRLERQLRGSVITLHRNAHYWNNANTAIDIVRHHVIEEPTTEIYRYRAGELDITSTIPTGSFAQLKAQMPDHVRTAPNLTTYFFGLNLTDPKLGDSRALREALSLAIDREAIVRDVVGRGEVAAYSFVPPGVNNYSSPLPAMAGMTQAQRIARARQLYAQAGFGPNNPLELELLYNTSDTHRRVAVAAQQMWKDALGFQVRLTNLELSSVIDRVRAKQTEAFRLGWGGEYNDANAFLYIFRSKDPSNLFGYQNDDFDSLMANAAGQSDPDRRRWYLEEAERVMLSEVPLIPIYYQVTKHLVHPRVKGWDDNVLDYHYSRHLSF